MQHGVDVEGVEVICAVCGCRHEPFEGYEERVGRQKREDERRGFDRNYIEEMEQG
jgi:hypothetical protein